MKRNNWISTLASDLEEPPLKKQRIDIEVEPCNTEPKPCTKDTTYCTSRPEIIIYSLTSPNNLYDPV